MPQPQQTHAWRSRIVGQGAADPASLTPHPQNWRAHPARQRAALTGVLEEVGWVQQVVVNRRTGHLLDGHLRVETARARGEAVVPVVYVDLAEAEERLVLATLDPIGALAQADGPALAALLAEVSTASEGVSQLISALARDADVATPQADPDHLPPSAPAAVSRPGDCWELGPHRVWCGDARNPASVGELFAAEPATWLCSDPPYGVDYVGRTPDRLRIRHDDSAGLRALLAGLFAAADGVLADGAAIYLTHPAGPGAAVFQAAVQAVGWTWHQTLIWAKDAFVLGHSDYHYQHEPILYAWKGSRATWYGDRAQASLLSIPRPPAPGGPSHGQAGRAGGHPAPQQRGARQPGLRSLPRFGHHVDRGGRTGPPLLWLRDRSPLRRCRSAPLASTDRRSRNLGRGQPLLPRD